MPYATPGGKKFKIWMKFRKNGEVEMLSDYAPDIAELATGNLLLIIIMVYTPVVKNSIITSSSIILTPSSPAFLFLEEEDRGSLLIR